ncbi:ATP-binding protein [Rhodobaculum claviforme]|uniref:ATP-binding protein n=1 Tax=Rhodobaculum claviforme TaxID=1549854 RepID=UPI0030840CF7
MPADLAPVAALLAGVPEPLLWVGAGNRIRMANPAAHELLGARLEGQSALLAIRQPEPVAALERAAAAAPGTRMEARYILTTPAAETIFRMVAHRLAPAGALEGVLVSFLDISHVEEAEQMRRDFVANVSHELRSPLTVLSGFIETLQGSARDDAPARERFLAIMAQEARRMNRLVGDLLSLSKVEANERVRPRDVVRMADVIGATLAALRPQIEEEGIRLSVRGLAPGEGGELPGDRDQLEQVVHNLVENAIKYGGTGGAVRITLEAHASWPGFSGPVLTLAVADDGEGIDPIHLPRLTERFYRVDSHRSRQMGGTGLGLAIVKHIVNRHRGRLSIDSVRGKGTTFLLVLPRQ